jgi:hypothetical protein
VAAKIIDFTPQQLNAKILPLLRDKEIAEREQRYY